MKKIIWILLIWTFLFSACSKEDDLFKKKQECAKYENSVRTWAKDYNLFFHSNLEEIFYSPTKNTCIWVISQNSPEFEWHKVFTVFDLLNSNKRLFWDFFWSCGEDIIVGKSWNKYLKSDCLKNESEYVQMLKELKWE
jgi:hypothetical protein